MTAVEWLMEQIDDMYIHQAYNKEFEQAIEIEKQQIIDAFGVGCQNTKSLYGYHKEAEQYYNEYIKTNNKL